MSAGVFYGYGYGIKLKEPYKKIKNQNLVNIDPIFTGYLVPTSEWVDYRYSIRFRVNPDGSVKNVAIVDTDHTLYIYEEPSDSGNRIKRTRLSCSFENENLKEAILDELVSWRFPETEDEITHYCWLSYNDYKEYKPTGK
jgi:hypothetical protein